MRVLMILLHLVLFTIMVIAHRMDLDQEWEQFKTDFKKTYSSDEEELKRRLIWEENIEYNNNHNQKADSGMYTYWLGTNHLSDLTQEEITAEFAMSAGSLALGETQISEDDIFVPPDVKLPDSVDWYGRGAVTPVKSQGGCGSCWAFSAIGSLEGMHALKTGNLLRLSEQNLVDCVTENGCDGGWMAPSYKYIKENGGINTEKSYPYEGNNTKCRFDPRYIGATVSSWKHIPHKNEMALQAAVATAGPVAFTLQCCTKDFSNFEKGVYTGEGCDTIRDLHAMVITGYGTSDDHGPYWWIKNSWGSNWGDNGYIFIRRNASVCGIADYAVFPIV